MALIQCPDCQRDVSDAAPACPGCGRPIRGAETPLSATPEPRVVTTPDFFWRDRNCGCLVGLIVLFCVLCLLVFK